MSAPTPIPQSPAPAGPEEVLHAAGWRRTFSSLRNRDYRWFYAGHGVSLIGTWARASALSWMAFEITKSEFITGLVAFMNSVPMLVFSLYAGSLADRHSKLAIFRFTSWAAMLTSAVFAALLFTGHRDAGTLLVFSLCWGVAMAFEMPARQSFVVEMVGKKDLANAIALNSALVNASRVVGPALGGFLYSFAGPAWCFFLDSVSYLGVLFGIGKIKTRPHPPPLSTASTWTHLQSSFRFIGRSPDIARVLGMLLVMSLGGWAYQSQLPPFVAVTLRQSAYGYGWLLAMAALGAFVAALWVAYLNDKLKTQRPAYVGILIYSASIILCGFQIDPVAAAFFLFFTGFGLILFFATSNSYLQTHIPDHLRGRLMGVWALVFGGGMPLGNLWMGAVAEKIGSARTLQLGGLICLVAGSAIYFTGRKQHASPPNPKRP